MSDNALQKKPHTRAPRGFRITSGKGFHITFDNGYTVSVQFGGGNYCLNRDDDITGPSGDIRKAWRESGERGSPDAETAVWGPDGDLIDRGGGDTVQGWQSASDVLGLLNWAASQPTPTEERPA